MSGDCLAVWGIADGETLLADHTAGHNSSMLMQVTNEMFESDLNDGHSASYINANFKKDACYLKIRDKDYSNEEQHLTHIKNILCTAGPVLIYAHGHERPGLDPGAAGRTEHLSSSGRHEEPRQHVVCTS